MSEIIAIDVDIPHNIICFNGPRSNTVFGQPYVTVNIQGVVVFKEELQELPKIKDLDGAVSLFKFHLSNYITGVQQIAWLSKPAAIKHNDGSYSVSAKLATFSNSNKNGNGVAPAPGVS